MKWYIIIKNRNERNKNSTHPPRHIIELLFYKIYGIYSILRRFPQSLPLRINVTKSHQHAGITPTNFLHALMYMEYILINYRSNCIKCHRWVYSPKKIELTEHFQTPFWKQILNISLLLVSMVDELSSLMHLNIYLLLRR